MESMAVPARFFHATPMYRYDPDMAQDTGVWPVPDPIKAAGLQPSDASHKQEPSVYLASDASVARNYASGNFGEEEPVDWVILEIDASQLDPKAFRADLHGEAETAFHEINSEHGYSETDWKMDRLDWRHVMDYTGQCRYIKSIPSSAIRPIMTFDHDTLRWTEIGN